MIILGVDPGTVRTGYGVIFAQGSRARLLDHGVLRVARGPSDPLPERLLRIAAGLEALLDKHPVEVVALEEAFFGKSVQSALRIGEARGAVLVVAARRRLQVAQYAPARVKKAVVGDGGAVKERVQEMVRIALGLAQPPRPVDASDALAIALCHAFCGSHLGRLGL